MVEQRAQLKGTFLLSINDVPVIKSIFGAFSITAVQTRYSISKGAAASYAELLISTADLGGMGVRKGE